jgi:hypothetical protein
MKKPEYAVKYVCERYPDTILMRNEPLSAPKNRFLFMKYTTDLKEYKGSVFVGIEYFNEFFKELPR